MIHGDIFIFILVAVFAIDALMYRKLKNEYLRVKRENDELRRLRQLRNAEDLHKFMYGE